jgi:hypothetical protein
MYGLSKQHKCLYIVDVTTLMSFFAYSFSIVHKEMIHFFIEHIYVKVFLINVEELEPH